jgi:hypothetical protein
MLQISDPGGGDRTPLFLGKSGLLQGPTREVFALRGLSPTATVGMPFLGTESMPHKTEWILSEVILQLRDEIMGRRVIARSETTKQSKRL